MVDSEKRVEALLVSGVKRMGGLAYKFVSPGNSGVPDRIILMPGGKIYFVELKREDGQLTNLQKRQINRIQKRDCQVDVLQGMVEVSDCLLRLQAEQLEGGAGK